MPLWLDAALVSCLSFAMLLACKSRPEPPEQPQPPAAPASIEPLPEPAPSARPREAVAIEKALQARRLALPPQREHEPQLAFAKGVFAQLTADALCVFDGADFHLLAREPLEAPRAVVTLADGALLAVGSRAMLRWEAGKKHAKALARPPLWPGDELYPDPQLADRVWVFDPGSRAQNGTAPAKLSGFRLAPATATDAPPEPELTLELTSARGGVFGATREGVWLYVTPGSLERFAPGGLRLPGALASAIQPPTWVLPARRLDQSWWVDADGGVVRALVSPSFKALSQARLPGKLFAAGVGDEGRLLAAVSVTGEGPRFELLLFDGDLLPQGRVVLPADAPTGAEDWVQVVTQNQGVVVSARQPLLAIGGPGRAVIFDAHGNQIFSIPSR